MNAVAYVTLLLILATNQESQAREFSEDDFREQKSDCRLFSPKVNDLNIEYIDRTTINVTWSLQNTSDYKKLNKITKMEFTLDSYEECSVMESTNSWALINCSENFDEEFDTLTAEFLNVYNCTTNITTYYAQVDYLVAEDLIFRPDVQNLSEATVEPAVPVKEIKVDAFYNDMYKVIQLNISWSRPSGTFPEYYDFGVTHMENASSFCDQHYHYETLHNSKLLTNIMLPKQPASAVDELQAGCTYRVWVKSQYFDGELPSVVYTIPDCVGTICSYCKTSHLQPKAQLHHIKVLAANTLNITWSSDDHFAHNHTYVITNVKFMFRTNDSYATHECRVLGGVPQISENENVASVIQCDGLLTNHEYILIARFQNNYNCSKSYSKQFKVDSARTNEGIDQNGSLRSIWIETMVFFMGAAAVSLLVYFRCLPMSEKLRKLFIRTDMSESVEMHITSGRAGECYNIIYCESEILNGNVDVYEFPRSRIKLTKLLDSGAFGQVFSADILGPINGRKNQTVAVKTLRDPAPSDEVEDFLSEIDIMKKIGEHPNIITMIGCCTLKQPYLMIMELVPCGSLKSYLLKLRNRWETIRISQDSVFNDTSDGAYVSPDSPISSQAVHKFPSITESDYTNIESEGGSPLMDKFNHVLEPVLDNLELQNFAFQIAKGMAYLEEIQITHRDLAARNVLISEFKTLKISDFGLSRAGPYVNNKTKKLPLRWMAIESIEDHFYNNKSDVWSFGVVLWEIGSLGALPYERTPDCLILHDLLIGKRLERPGICTDELYALMLQCWAQEPKMRPAFREILELFGTSEKRIYVDFGQLNPTYVFPPSRLELR